MKRLVPLQQLIDRAEEEGVSYLVDPDDICEVDPDDLEESEHNPDEE